MGTGGVDAEGMHGGEVGVQIGAKTVGSDERAVAAVPVGVVQVGIGVGAEEMVLLVEMSNCWLECRIAIEAAGEEKGSGDMVFAQDAAKGAVEKEKTPFLRGVFGG